VIELKNVTKTFRRQRVLDALSLRIDDHDRVALIGSNGAGKTTLIRCLLGEYTCEGVIRVDGRSPHSERTAVLRGIGFVPQLPPPLRMPVADLIRFAARVSGGSEARILEVVCNMGLDFAEVAGKPFVKLSGGQKQKILSSIALGRSSRLLILDEPAANLDPAARKVLFDLLAKRRSDPIVISSHRLEEVAGLVNRVVELDRGHVVLDDRVEDAGQIRGLQPCTLVVGRNEPAFARAVGEWGFQASEDGLAWVGEVAAPDRLRFLGLLSRYAGIITSLHLDSPREPRLPVNGTAGPASKGEADAYRPLA
jgi:ABC-2 type transport system ATP-binding protein